jgi:Lon protease-like protein
MDGRTPLDAFDGTARLFPLPNLVMFPGADQGLHIFEHRYRRMTADALASDRLIALVLLKPEWEGEYDAAPPVERLACLGSIAHSERLIDGRYYLRVRGLARFAISQEVPNGDKLYRMASGRIIAETAPADPVLLSELRRELRECALARFDSAAAHLHLSALFSSDLTLGELCDRLGYCLPLPGALKQNLLAEPDAASRARALSGALAGADGSNRRFPPRFSAN